MVTTADAGFGGGSPLQFKTSTVHALRNRRESMQTGARVNRNGLAVDLQCFDASQNFMRLSHHALRLCNRAVRASIESSLLANGRSQRIASVSEHTEILI